MLMNVAVRKPLVFVEELRTALILSEVIRAHVQNQATIKKTVKV